MRKTKREKLKSLIRRQKEFERIREKPLLPQLDNRELSVTQDTGQFFSSSQNTPKKEISNQNLTNLSYLPKQLAKIGVITFVLILVQIVLYLTIL